MRITDAVRPARRPDRANTPPGVFEKRFNPLPRFLQRQKAQATSRLEREVVRVLNVGEGLRVGIVILPGDGRFVAPDKNETAGAARESVPGVSSDATGTPLRRGPAIAGRTHRPSNRLASAAPTRSGPALFPSSSQTLRIIATFGMCRRGLFQPAWKPPRGILEEPYLLPRIGARGEGLPFPGHAVLRIPGPLSLPRRLPGIRLWIEPPDNVLSPEALHRASRVVPRAERQEERPGRLRKISGRVQERRGEASNS